jgi:DnaK suppressor protein
VSKSKAPAAAAKGAKSASKATTKASLRPATKTAAKPKPAPKPAAKAPTKAAAKATTKAVPKAASKPATKAASKALPKAPPKAASKPAAKTATKTAVPPAKNPPAKGVAKPAGKPAAKPTPVATPTTKAAKSTNTAAPAPKPSSPPVTAPTAPTPAAVLASSTPKAAEGAKVAPEGATPARATKGRSSGRHEPPAQPIPAAPIHPANRFADRFAPAKTSARYLPEPMVDTKPAAKPDPKLANAWKTKAGRDLTEAELLAMPEGEYMNDKQVEFFKARLNALKDDLLSNAGETTEHLREDTTIVPDPADRATIEEEHALELRTRDRERKLLRKISQSLARLDSGEYGYCEETGEEIGLGRLLARPTATLSLEAQQRRELKQRMFGD